MKFRNVLFIALSSVLIISCRKDDEESSGDTGNNQILQGYYLVNEGSFGGQNASVDFWHDGGEVSYDLYYEKNGVPMGDVLQSIHTYGSRVFAVMNNSQRVVVFDANSFQHMGTIEGLSYPRHMATYGNLGFISDGSFDGTVRVVNLGTLEVLNNIPVGMGPERMIINGNHLFVCNSGGWASDNTISVIDMSSQAVIGTIAVSDRPMDIVKDANGDIWVLCSGNVLYDDQWNVVGHTAPYLCRIDPGTLTMNLQVSAGAEGEHPQSLDISADGQHLLFVNENLMKLDVDDAAAGAVMFSGGPYYTVDVDKTSGNIFLTTIPDFVSPSSVIQLSSEGFVVSAVEAGIGTNAVVVKN